MGGLLHRTWDGASGDLGAIRSSLWASQFSLLCLSFPICNKCNNDPDLFVKTLSDLPKEHDKYEISIISMNVALL